MVNIEVGKHYRFIYENGFKIAGELTDIKRLGTVIYSLWIEIGRQPVYIAYCDVKEIVEIDSYEFEH
ncbi:hypothetical protein [Bacillus sp. FJAT-28004]|uniref:hypothetical protein n=1 Tax=Bacillus sp. FJAT-28004 TaxID=1679165 RepID=UPI0006B5E439|nr:hypothetical protein [Bacillus sp. FJAT-28004]